jgi:hypothetical protein
MKSGIIYKQWSDSVFSYNPIDQYRRRLRSEVLFQVAEMLTKNSNY